MSDVDVYPIFFLPRPCLPVWLMHRVCQTLSYFTSKPLSVRVFCSCAAPLRVNPVRRMSQPAAAVAEALVPKKKEKARKPYKEPAVAFPLDAQPFPYIDAHTHFQSVFEAIVKVMRVLSYVGDCYPRRMSAGTCNSPRMSVCEWVYVFNR